MPASTTIVAMRTHRLRHSPRRPRAFTPCALGPAPFTLDCDNPVRPHVEWQFLPEPFDERVAVLVQEPDEGDRALLRMPVGEGQRSCALELAPQRLVFLFRRLNRLALKRFQILLD